MAAEDNKQQVKPGVILINLHDATQEVIEGITLEDLIAEHNWVKTFKEKERARNARRERPPTGNPRGRPKKSSNAADASE
jgi:hypothetical protein